MPPTIEPPPSFEAAVSELEHLVDDMESGSISLEQALLHYRRGVDLLRYCQDRLKEADQQLRMLDGDTLAPLTPTSGPSGGYTT
ncbi:MAG: exodeoxyribonuclease VII small subunit [Rhodocyclaceae bacterium]